MALKVSIVCDDCGTALEHKLGNNEQVSFRHEQKVRDLARTLRWKLVWYPSPSRNLSRDFCPDCRQKH